MELKNTVLDKKLNLVGFVIEGKEVEFGGLSEALVSRMVSGKEMIRLGFVNNQIDMRGGTVKCLGKFELKQLHPKVIVDNELYDIGNTVALTKRILYNGVLKGFEVESSNGLRVRLTYDSVIKLGKIINGSNFAIRCNNNRYYVVGRNGSIKELPEIELGKKKETSDRKRAGISTKQVEKDCEALEDADLLSLYEIVDSVDGIIVKLPGEIYDARAGIGVRDSYDESFRSLGIGEVGQPRLDFGEKRLNANTNFKNLGIVNVVVNGEPTPVYSFTHSAKTIFDGLENHMKHFVIGVTQDVVNKIGSVYGNNLIVNTINDGNITKPIADITGKDLVYFEVDTSHLKLISDKKAEQISNTNIKEIGNSVYQLAILKARSKLLKDIAIEAIKLGNITRESIDSVAHLFSGFSGEYLSAFKASGIDVYTGVFTKQKIVGRKVGSSTNNNKKETSKKKEVMIELAIKGLDNKKLTLKNIKDVLNNGGNPASKIVLLADLISIATELYNEKNYVDRVKKARELKNEVDREIAEIVKRLWLWKVSIVTMGDGTVLDTGNWESVNSRSKHSLVYESKDVEGLVLKLTDIQLGKKPD